MALFILKEKAFFTKFLFGILFGNNDGMPPHFYFFFPIAFKSMLEFNAMVKGIFPHVKVLFVFPLTHSACLLNKRRIERPLDHSAALVNSKLPGNDS